MPKLTTPIIKQMIADVFIKDPSELFVLNKDVHVPLTPSEKDKLLAAACNPKKWVRSGKRHEKDSWQHGDCIIRDFVNWGCRRNDELECTVFTTPDDMAVLEIDIHQD